MNKREHGTNVLENRHLRVQKDEMKRQSVGLTFGLSAGDMVQFTVKLDGSDW